MPAESAHAALTPAGAVSTIERSSLGRAAIDPASIGDAPTSSGSAGAGAPGQSAAAVFSSIQAVDPAALPGFLNSHASDLDRLLVNPPAASDVSQLWKLLDPARQAELVKVAPHVVGNLEGVPYDIRGKANRLDLERTISSAKAKLGTERGRAARVALKRQLTTLGNVKTALAKKDGVTRTLVSLDPSDDAKASIVVGDLRTASYVSVLVPGMYMAVGEQIEAWSDVAQNLYEQQTGFLKRLGGPGTTKRTPGVAVVAWIGYQTPVLTNIGGLDLAQQGADSLERTLLGIQSLRVSNPPYLSVLAHSYGSTAALLALEHGTVTVDALALMGSPGSDAQSVKQLGVRGGNVFVGEASMDPIVNSAFFGSDPGSPSYGAKSMGVGGAVDPITHRALTGSSGHNEYFTAGTECMRNLALIGIDRGDLVLDGRGTGTTQTASSR